MKFRYRPLGGLAIMLALLAGFGRAAPADEARAPRIVSLNPCLDAVLVQVADRDQILALSHYARNPHSSTIVELAKTFPIVYETAEEIVALRPDLVLGSAHSSPETRAALTRLGIETAVFGVPTTVAQSLDEVRRVAKLAGHPERGEKLIQRIEDALAAAAPPAGMKPIPALIFQPDGFSPGSGELADEMLRRTGFSNVAADRYGRKGWSNLPLEFVVADPPEMILSAQPESGGQSWAERISNHPALAHLSNIRRAVLPESLIFCGGPALIESAEALARARRGVEAGQ